MKRLAQALGAQDVEAVDLLDARLAATHATTGPKDLGPASSTPKITALDLRSETDA